MLFNSFHIRPVKINVLVLIRIKSKRGREVFFFLSFFSFKTAKMTLDHEYNEWTETV